MWIPGQTDPCCDRYAEQRRLRGRIATRRTDVTITGVFDGVDVDAERLRQRRLVTNFIEQSMKDVLMAATHPVGATPATPNSLTTVGFGSAMDARCPCHNQVIWGQSQGLEYCNTNDQCWSQSCVSDGHMSRCARITGAAALPILNCVLEKIDPDVHKHCRNSVSTRSGSRLEGRPDKGGEGRVCHKLKMATGINCTGPDDKATEGWCTIGLTQRAEEAWDQND